MRYITVRPDHPSRSEIEDHICHIYRNAFGASVDHFPYYLVAGLDGFGKPACAAGLRLARSGFFSEAYLDEPIETAIFGLSGHWVSRSELVEITTLASSEPGAAIGLFNFIARTSAINGWSWAVFTATKSLRRCLRRIGAPLIEIATARPERLADAAVWGRYYETDPRVCAFKNSSIAPVRFDRPLQSTLPPRHTQRVLVSQHA